jgi:hypothetical protein
VVGYRDERGCLVLYEPLQSFVAKLDLGTMSGLALPVHPRNTTDMERLMALRDIHGTRQVGPLQFTVGVDLS